MKPLAIELFSGRFGWGKGFVAEGFRVIGFDILHESYHGPVPEGCELVLQDILTLHGSQLKDAACIVASPPCQKYSYMAMPWDLSKREIRWQEWERDSRLGSYTLTQLFDACFRIQREASEAAGHYIPMLVENVKGAQPWVGRAAWHYGSQYLWGDVPALMPPSFGVKKGMSCGRNAESGKWMKGGPNDPRNYYSTSPQRKAASALAAEIPIDLSRWIAQCFRP